MLNPTFSELNLLQRSEFIGKLIIAAETNYFSECSDIVNKAQDEGLFNRAKPLLDCTCSQIKDLDNPIENGVNNY